MNRSRLEQQFISQWAVRFPELPFQREFVLPAWREWAAERKAQGRVTRAVPMRADFAWPESRVALEIQGGTWATGGHSTGRGIERDAIKSLLAQGGGWLLVAFTDHMLIRDGRLWLPRLAAIIRTRANHGNTTAPLPSAEPAPSAVRPPDR